jgi:hypothetical protein
MTELRLDNGLTKSGAFHRTAYGMHGEPKKLVVVRCFGGVCRNCAARKPATLARSLARRRAPADLTVA